MFFTQNPIGSSANEDLQDNAISFDYAMNSPAALWQDRFGKQHKTVQQALKDVGFKPAGFDFVSGGTLGIGDRDKCVFYPTDGYWYSWNGKLPYVIPTNSSPTPGGKKGWAPRVQVQLPNGINPRDWPYNYRDEDPIEVRTSSLQAAFNAANSEKREIYINGYYHISSILLDSHSDYKISGSGAIIGVSSGPYVLGIKNSVGIKGGNGIIVTGAAGMYSTGVKIWGEGKHPDGNLNGCSLHTLGFSVTNVSPAWTFGDLYNPDNLVSEIVINSGYTYNVNEVAHVIGSQTVIEFLGYQSVVIGDNARAFTIVGGVLHINGGEVMIPGVTDGCMVSIYPVNSIGFAKKYGSCYINGASIECASLWLLAYNPNNVNTPERGSGVFVMDNCSGYINFEGDNLQSSTEFDGRVVITDTCHFYRSVPKPIDTYISGLLGESEVKISSQAFDNNFHKERNLYRPGPQRPKFGLKEIFNASNLSGGSFPPGPTTLIFKSIPSDGTISFYYPNYNLTSGVFTTGSDVLKDVSVHLCIKTGVALPNSEIEIHVNGVLAGSRPITALRNGYTFHLGNLNPTTRIQLLLNNRDTGFSVTTTNLDKMIIQARTE